MNKITDDDLKQLAKDFCHGKVFTSDHLPKKDLNLIPNIFLPVLFADLPKDVAFLYGYYDEAMPNSINGYPIFDSIKYLCNDNMEKLKKYVEKYKVMMEEFDNA